MSSDSGAVPTKRESPGFSRGECQAEYEFTDEMRQDLLAFYQQNYNQIVQGYGETFARRVYEENEGLQAVVLVTYTTTDADGVTGGPPADSSEGLSISLVNGANYN